MSSAEILASSRSRMPRCLSEARLRAVASVSDALAGSIAESSTKRLSAVSFAASFCTDRLWPRPKVRRIFRMSSLAIEASSATIVLAVASFAISSWAWTMSLFRTSL